MTAEFDVGAAGVGVGVGVGVGIAAPADCLAAKGGALPVTPAWLVLVLTGLVAEMVPEAILIPVEGAAPPAKRNDWDDGIPMESRNACTSAWQDG